MGRLMSLGMALPRGGGGGGGGGRGRLRWGAVAAGATLLGAWWGTVAAGDEEAVAPAARAKAPEVPRYDFVLVGGGLASYMALKEILREHEHAKVLLIGEPWTHRMACPPPRRDASARQATRSTLPTCGLR